MSLSVSPAPWTSRGQLYTLECQLTDALAKSNVSLPEMAAVVSGHFHSWELLQFGPARPAQLVAGNSGTQLATPRDGSPDGIFRAAWSFQAHVSHVRLMLTV